MQRETGKTARTEFIRALPIMNHPHVLFLRALQLAAPAGPQISDVHHVAHPKRGHQQADQRGPEQVWS